MNNLVFSDIAVNTWVQGGPLTAADLSGSVVLIEVFQVNCPGCFLNSLPRAIQLHEIYQDKGLIVIGLATAFEDYDKNTLENLRRLVDAGEVVGETYKALSQHQLLVDGKIRWRIPFAVGMDEVTPETEPVTDQKVRSYARQCLPEFETLKPEQKQAVLDQVKTHLTQKTMTAKTFERFSLQGTPSCILLDREGQLRDVSFGQVEHKRTMVEQLLAE